MQLNVCVPAYNESLIIVQALTILKSALDGLAIPYSIAVIDNGSTDDTVAHARTVAGVSVRRIEEKGKGLAIATAARESQADFFAFIDADLSADPHSIHDLLAPLLSNDCDIAIGSRLADVTLVRRSMLRTMTSQVFNAMRRFIIGVKATDTQCGLKCMNARGRDVLAQCEETGWFFDMEFLARAEQHKLRIKEIPVRWDEHRFPDRKSKLRVIQDGIGAIRAMIRIRRRLMSQ
jgi:glycosyltransferase involved in cell wall biosynthesis